MKSKRPDLKALRDARKWTQLQLGEAAGVRPETISRIERNDGYVPSFETRYKLRDVFGDVIPLEDSAWQ